MKLAQLIQAGLVNAFVYEAEVTTALEDNITEKKNYVNLCRHDFNNLYANLSDILMKIKPLS